MDTSITPPKWWKSKKLLLAVAAGAGLLCYLLPEKLQGPCHLCAKVIGIAVGAP